MIVCMCHGINDDVLHTIVQGGARTLRDVGDACGAGTDCGLCCRDILRTLKSRKGSIRPARDEAAPLSK